jgi:hypothetical protein
MARLCLRSMTSGKRANWPCWTAPARRAIETFIAHCDVAASDLLLPYGDVVMTLSIVLPIKRTLDGTEIDKIISDVQARKAQAIEHRRRADWRKRELAATGFTRNVITRMPHRRHTLLQIGWGNHRQLDRMARRMYPAR